MSFDLVKELQKRFKFQKGQTWRFHNAQRSHASDQRVLSLTRPNYWRKICGIVYLSLLLHPLSQAIDGAKACVDWLTCHQFGPVKVMFIEFISGQCYNVDKDGSTGMWGLLKTGTEVFFKGSFARPLSFSNGMCKAWTISHQTSHSSLFQSISRRSWGISRQPRIEIAIFCARAKKTLAVCKTVYIFLPLEMR